MTREVTYDRHVSVDNEGFDCALTIRVWDSDAEEVAKEIRIPVEDIPNFLRDVANHAATALSTAARRLEVGDCGTCGNTGLVYEERHGRPWSVHCPDCRPRWPAASFANAPRIGKRGGTDG